jgi:N-acetylglucosamine-6-phosphate deacetylase
MLAALAGGNRLVTHLYSCTSTITRHGGFRHLGVIESAYLLDDIYVEAIADGCHLPPELLRLIVKQKGVERVCLITDAIRFAGRQSGEVGGAVPYVIEDGVAKLADRSAFAGSIATVDVLIRRTVNAGISLAETVQMMTETPAKVMGLEGMGRIDKGYRAVFTILDRELCVRKAEEF